MRRYVSYCYLVAIIASASAAPAEEPSIKHLRLDPWTGEGVSLGGILFPEINYQVVAGSSTTDPESLAVGHHDPDRHGVTQQAIEFALGARFGKHVRLFGSYSAKIDQDDHWLELFEEYYAEITGLPLGVELKGGRFYTRFGLHNTEHLHQYTFVDQFLASGRFLGEHSATVEGAQISLPVLSSALPVGWSDRLSISYGSAVQAHDHDHDHEHEDHHDEPPFEGHRAAWSDSLATVDYTIRYSPRKAVSYAAGVSGAWGGNDFDRQTHVYGAHFEYLWRPSGASAAHAHEHHDHGEFFRWRTEVFVRHFGAEGIVEEEVETTTIVPGTRATYRPETQFVGFRPVPGGGFAPFFRRVTVVDRPATPAQKVTTTAHRERAVRDDSTDAGVYTALTYGFPRGHVEAHLRAEYVSGTADAELPERYRLSPAITLRPSRDLPFHFKLQYNYDHLPALGDEHSLWAQFSLTWGDPCTHAH
jgi:hypothetical protein